MFTCVCVPLMQLGVILLDEQRWRIRKREGVPSTLQVRPSLSLSSSYAQKIPTARFLCSFLQHKGPSRVYRGCRTSNVAIFPNHTLTKKWSSSPLYWSNGKLYCVSFAWKTQWFGIKCILKLTSKRDRRSTYYNYYKISSVLPAAIIDIHPLTIKFWDELSL
jgi:hypothetical protein